MHHDETIESPRMSLREVAPEAYKAMQALERTIQVEPTIRHLIKVRASILNGCAYCVDMHTKLARKDGETEQRLYAVATWHEAPFFTPRERAALALTDEVTRIEGRVPRDVWDFAAKHFTPEELANLVWAIAAINTWNRVVVAMRTLPGTFQA